MNYLFATKIKLFLQDRHMCVNYTPTRKEALADFGVNGQQLDDYKAETWQDYAAPIIRHSNHGEREVMLASYGMIPKEKMPIGAKRYSTMNARAETIGQLRTYANHGEKECCAWYQCNTFLNLATSQVKQNAGGSV
jgi:putative SOS response-associated peptidase YedK